MPPPPERILLFRSGRHLQTALSALRTAFPGCEVAVVATPAALPALDAAGLDEAQRIIYDRTPFFRPLSFIASPAGRQARGRRFDRVAVLWNDPDGAGQANVDHTALLVAPRGFIAITPDGTLVTCRSTTLLGRELACAVRSLAVGAALTILLYAPARLVQAVRRL